MMGFNHNVKFREICSPQKTPQRRRCFVLSDPLTVVCLPSLFSRNNSASQSLLMRKNNTNQWPHSCNAILQLQLQPYTTFSNTLIWGDCWNLGQACSCIYRNPRWWGLWPAFPGLVSHWVGALHCTSPADHWGSGVLDQGLSKRRSFIHHFQPALKWNAKKQSTASSISEKQGPRHSIK